MSPCSHPHHQVKPCWWGRVWHGVFCCKSVTCQCVVLRSSSNFLVSSSSVAKIYMNGFLGQKNLQTKKSWSFWKNSYSWKIFYTTAGRDGRDKFQVWLRSLLTWDRALQPPHFMSLFDLLALQEPTLGLSEYIRGFVLHPMELFANREYCEWRKFAKDTLTRKQLVDGQFDADNFWPDIRPLRLGAIWGTLLGH